MSGEALNSVPLQEDGSYEDAVAAMPDLLADDPKGFDDATGYAKREAERGEDGKFKAKEDPLKADEPAKKDETKAEPAKDAKDAATEEEDDYIEFPPEEEGKEPVRHKLQEIVDGWQKAKTLEDELKTARETTRTPLPQEVEEHVTALQKERSQLVAAMQQWQDLNKPVPPDPELRNPASPRFNPDLAWAQEQEFRRLSAAQQEVAKRIEAAETQTKTEKEALRASKITREVAELQKIWPEILKDPVLRDTTKKALFDHYKIDEAFLNSDITTDHRIYALAKDALKLRALEAKQVEAVKAVKAKPRLVQGQARQAPSSQKAAKFASSFEALSKSGSLEDAANALEGFIF